MQDMAATTRGLPDLDAEPTEEQLEAFREQQVQEHEERMRREAQGLRATEYIEGLRAAADWMEKHPEFVPAGRLYIGETKYAWEFKGDDDERQEQAKAWLASAIKVMPRPVRKEADGYALRLITNFGPHEFRLGAARDLVCERIVVKSETVVETVPDPELLEAATKGIPTVEVERVIEEIAWSCPPSFMAEPESETLL